jgi:hypothetical protein
VAFFALSKSMGRTRTTEIDTNSTTLTTLAAACATAMRPVVGTHRLERCSAGNRLGNAENRALQTMADSQMAASARRSRDAICVRELSPKSDGA